MTAIPPSANYDALNRPVRVASPAFNHPTHGLIRPVSIYDYDALGNLITVDAGYTDSTGTNTASDVVVRQRTSSYDDWSRVLSDTDALGRTEHSVYNTHGDRIRFVDRKEQIIERDYYYGGLLEEQRTYTSAFDNDPDVYHYDRNALGQVKLMTSPEVNYSYQYDAANRIYRITDSRGGASLTYHWSPGGQLDTLEDSEGRLTDYLYDPTGRLNTLWAPDGEVISFQYDDGGRLTRQEMPGNVVTTYDYYNDDAVEQMTTTGPGGTIYQQSYTYDNLARRDSMTENLRGE